jgi:glycosyltransferase involved in cell wall biosynthesis
MIMVGRVDCNDGVASHIESLVRGMKSRGIAVVIISGPVRWDMETEVRYRAILESVDDWLVLEDLRTTRPAWKDLKQIISMVRRHAIEIIHVHGFGVLPLTVPVRLATGLRTVVTFHPSAHADRPADLRKALGQAKSLSYRMLLKLTAVTQVIAYSQEIEDFFINDVHLPRKKISRTPLGIDIDYYRPPTHDERHRSRDSFAFDSNDFVVSLVGRMSWNKGQDVLIDAVRSLNNEIEDSGIKCLFAGSGYQAAEIQRYACEQLGDDRQYHFSSFAKDLRPIYWASDLFVMPSRNEGFGLAAVEAMACGLPVVRTPSGGARDQIVDGHNGFLIGFDSPGQLAGRIKQLRQSTSLTQCLSANAIKTAHRDFTISKMVDETLSTYCKAMS